MIDGLKRVANAQNQNPWLTINATVTAGIWIFYKNRRRWLINPAQRYLRIENAFNQVIEEEDADIEQALNIGIESGDVTNTGKTEFKQWRVLPAAFPLVWKFLEDLDKPQDFKIEIDAAHPRYFPGDVRQMALTQFEKDGRICPGVGKQKSHKLTEVETCEFDHILPHSKGGSSTYRNIQILCTKCNRLKRNSAL